MPDPSPPLLLRHLGTVDYADTWAAMRAFTEARTPDTPDELWLLEHPPVFTLGQAGRREHVLDAGDIPLVQTDRGGQVTYHGPGQLTGYCLIDLRRLDDLGPRAFVEALEDALVEVLQGLGIDARADRTAHGVYVGPRKIASLGLRIRRGCSYHGFSLNVDMDLEPFARINPCGYAGLAMTQVKDFLGATTPTPALLGEHVAAAVSARLYGGGS